MTEKPFAPACERNRDPILGVLQRHLQDARNVLEIGSGTGQHAVHFARHMPHLVWQCSDRSQYLSGISCWLDEAALPNTPAPFALDATGTWPSGQYDAVFSANTLHIMSWDEVKIFFTKLPSVLEAPAKLIIYGPFRYGEQHTSQSNADFDRSLRANRSYRGIRDFHAVNALAEKIGLELIEDNDMPANNRCIVWQR